MFCRLCCSDSISSFQDLSNADGMPSDVHITVLKYFELSVCVGNAAVKNSGIVCNDCWQHVNDFDKFKETILNAQQQYNSLTEDLMNNPIKEECLSDYECQAEYDYSSDNTPLMVLLEKGLRPKVKTVQNKKEATELLPLTEIELESVDAMTDDWTQACSSANETAEDPVQVTTAKVVPRTRQRKLTKTAKKPKTKRNVGRPRKVQSAKTAKSAANPQDESFQGDENTKNNTRKDESKLKKSRKDATSQDEIFEDDENIKGETIKEKSTLKKSKKDATSQDETFHGDDHTKGETNNHESELKKTKKDVTSQGETLQGDENTKNKAKKDKSKLKKSKKDATSQDEAFQDDENTKDDKDASNILLAEYWKMGLPCGLCNATGINYPDLHKHYRNEHNDTRGFVLCCGRKLYQRHELVEHVQLHLNPQVFQCPQCKKCSQTKRGLHTHIKRMHTDVVLERKYECEVCHKRFTKPVLLRYHRMIHIKASEDNKCTECGKCFGVAWKLQNHMRTVHDPANTSICEQCGKSFKDKSAFKMHMLQHNGIAPRKWPCDQCNATLISKSSLKRHMLQHGDNSVAYKCSICGKVALTATALRSHKRHVHEGERKHICNVCGKGFKVHLVLKEHMTIHTGEALYKCPHCPKTFRVSSNMHHHRKRVHPKEWAETHRVRELAASTDLSSINKEIVI